MSETYTVRSFKGKSPVIPKSCTVFENCSIYGNVILGENCVIMPGTVIRAESGSVIIGENTNIQDMCCIHTDTYEGADVIIGSNVTVGLPRCFIYTDLMFSHICFEFHSLFFF